MLAATVEPAVLLMATTSPFQPVWAEVEGWVGRIRLLVTVQFICGAVPLVLLGDRLMTRVMGETSENKLMRTASMGDLLA